MQIGMIATWRAGTRRRIAALTVFWALWVLLIGLANGFGVIDATLAFDVAH